MSPLELGMPGSLVAALVAGALQPLYLLSITRIAAFQGRNPLQFLLSALTALAGWLVVLAVAPSWRPADCAQAGLALMALGSTMLFYLEIWGLLSRGYTLGILLTLERANRPLTAEEIRREYRGGDGLDWILRHRLGGMEAAGVLERRGDDFALSGMRGPLVARAYLLGLAALGLGRSG